MRQRSVMKHDFSRIPRANIMRSRFNRSHGYKTTFDGGYLIPFFWDEVIPGDTFSLRPILQGRVLSPLIVPVMDNMKIETFFFFVPNRLVWDNFQPFMGEQANPGDSTDFLIPILDMDTATGGFAIGSVFDYMGIPTGIPTATANPNAPTITALPFRAMNLIWNEWFRSEDLQDSLEVPKDDGPDDTSLYPLLRRGKRHDYFTSCLPWPQKGPGVEIPIGTTAALLTDPHTHTLSPVTSGLDPTTSTPIFRQYAGGNTLSVFSIQATGSNTSTGTPIETANTVSQNTPPTQFSWWNPGLTGHPMTSATVTGSADLSSAQAATINSLRQAFQLQRLLERDARGGTRYTEILRSHFGVVSPDARLQRPEYLGGSSRHIGVYQVPQTSSTDATSAQANLSAYGTFESAGGGFTKSFVEHGFVIGFVNVRADLTYQQGLDRRLSRRTRFDHYWPALAHLGEQVVKNKEIYMQANSDDNLPFGYQEAWAEMRYANSRITGLLRSTAPQSLDIWTLTQRFDSLPVLNQEFIQDDPPIDRIIAVPSEPHFIMDVYFQYHCTRPMPTYSVPGLIDHF